MARPKAGYRNTSGKRVPGVTTIIGRFKESGGLIRWAYQQGMASERGEIGDLYEKRDEAGEAGTLAHDMVEAHIKVEDPEALVDTDKYSEEVISLARRGFNNFVKWQEGSRLKVEYTEEPLVCNEYDYGGTPDGIGIDSDDRYCLIDWKTGNACYPDFLVQMAAYKVMWEENHPDKIITGGFHLVRFSKEYADFTHHYFEDLDDAWEQFLLFRRAYEIDKQLKKRSK